MHVSRIASVLALLVLMGCQAWSLPSERSSVAAASSAPLQPEIATGYTPKTEVVSQRFAVAAAHPLATQAGLEMLQAGGSAVDAAVAVQMVLGLVEPQSSGIGGGAFLVHAAGANVQVFDGRETAPAAVTEDALLDDAGRPLAFHKAVVGGRSVGTPGVLHMLAQAHRQHGVLPWPRLFEPAIRLARQGFAISPRLHEQLKADAYLRLDPVARAYFYQAQAPLDPHPVGYVLRNPELADVLQRIATEGVSAFYTGEVAQAIVDKVQQHPSNPGRLQLRDLANYQTKLRVPLCFDLSADLTGTGAAQATATATATATVQAGIISRLLPSAAVQYRICGAPPPSSGTLVMAQILGMLPHTALAGQSWSASGPDVSWIYAYNEASRLAFADRAHYVADPDFVTPPGGDWQSLLQPDYLKSRAQLIKPVAAAQVAPGEPVPRAGQDFSSMVEQPEVGTSHLSIVDAQGRAVAMTTTIEDAFGARQMVKGFLLNNELTDFSFVPRDAQGRLVANRVQPGKRPRSSMSPTLVFDKSTGQLRMSLGSPGGPMIIHFTTKTLLGVLQQGWSPQAALDSPNFGSLGGPLVLESGRFSASAVDALRARGTEVRTQALTSGVHVVMRQQRDGRSVWIGAADPRREGVALGE
ncbi:gamma-glutamyltransferase family protein [Limnohabitans sp. B9-3]|uniref:gamma-glutamyltransferase family protein n=1 Tax=Limnohabitans sp. B9-3 TaxID=1100707 RepID=UPI000C1F4637|nr:gamma-glutamyltransferase family protein [Limnohabitans sp. B9-3]PIT78758.1 gamma-glutamyltransferase [Limnohabitans sp. B9-3]